LLADTFNLTYTVAMKQKLIAWFKKETDKPYVIYLLGFIAFFESIIFPVPVDIFTLTLASAHPHKWFSYGTVATITSVLGAVGGYFLGFYLFESFGLSMIEFYGYQDEFARVTELFNNNVFLVMFTAAFTPIPYKVFTLAGGALGVALTPFIIASILGRGLRFFAETWIPYKYGAQVAQKLEKNLALISWSFAILAIAYLIFRSL
jgi:membrane protein YqaA with SNARE-associated domain